MADGSNASHKIRRLEVRGGFWDGLEMDFAAGLNCIIGARGTGKTTILELCRHCLGQTHVDDPNREQQLAKLIKANLDRGTIEVTIETRDGMIYRVARGSIGDPEVSDQRGAPVELSLNRGQVFAADFYSQHEIEDIAISPKAQLAIIDQFISDEIAELEPERRGLSSELEKNSADIHRLRQAIADREEALAEIPEIKKRLEALDVGGDKAEDINREVALKGSRDQEKRTIKRVDETLASTLGKLEDLTRSVRGFGRIVERFEGENNKLFERLQMVLEQAGNDVAGQLGAARKLVEETRTSVEELDRELGESHSGQEQRYAELLQQHQDAQAQAREGARLQGRLNELLEQKRQVERRRQELNELTKQRGELLDKLSELHDRVFMLRQRTAKEISGRLEPDIRVSITQFGERGDYAERLRVALKGQGRHYNTLVGRIEQNLPPRELVRLIERSAVSELATALEVRDEQGDWLVDRLRAAEDGKLLLDLEALQLEDRPKIELRDGGAYKDASTLSTGQKCTTILPILLLDSDRPLLIDQPEDNLDNAFIYETVVRNIGAVKAKRQLIFVTHNPNIPVLGDAECVFVTESDGQRGRLRTHGNVDTAKLEIEQILEGGAEAFLERKRRYGH
ncbi:MAG: AAA family ATPase [Myxococcales bacterium]|nr:AAA family ATPase [Myxococcales bacterium]